MAGVRPGEVIAIRFGQLATTRADQFHRYDTYGTADEPMLMDYFFWAIGTDDSVVLVDCGYHPDAIKNRPGRVCLTPPVEALDAVGIAPDQVSRLVVSHGHFDHIGNLAAFTEARFTIQRRELDFWTGPYGREPAVRASVEPHEIEFLTRALDRGRVDVVDGRADIAPGVRAVLVPGHCPGQQVVEVRGTSDVLLCSDALHFYEEMTAGMPYHVFFDLAQMYAAYDEFRQYADRGFTVVPGHDPAVMSRFEPVPSAEGLAVRLARP